MGGPSRIWRVTDRASFDALRQGRRSRVGAVTVTYLPAPTDLDPPRVAFQVGRRTGNAVVRNRIRRRLRAGLRDLRQRGALPAGTYLVGGRRELADQPWTELLADLDGAVAQATAVRGAGS
ncbi:MAG: ribonuclease P protein component [Actinomycetota bacterium]